MCRSWIRDLVRDMNGPDSISDPVARRIRYTGSYPSARGSAPARLAAGDVAWWVPLRWRVSWLDAAMACQLCMLASWWHHPYPGLARGSGQLVFGSGQSIRVKKARVYVHGQPPRRRVTTRAAVFDVQFRRGFYQWLHLFLIYTVVWSKHNCDNFYFLAKIKHHFKPCALIPIVGGFRLPMCGPVMF